MSQPTAPLIEVEKIDVTDGFNVRTHMDDEAIEQLAANFKQVGVVQPVVVTPGEDGRYRLVAGHRRLRAAKVAGFTEIPGVLGDPKTARVANLVENLHQEALDPIDTAKGLKSLAEEHNLTTHKEIARQVSKSAQWVSQHMRLLELPEGVQAHVACGNVPVEAERPLRAVAKVSPRAAGRPRRLDRRAGQLRAARWGAPRLLRPGRETDRDRRRSWDLCQLGAEDTDPRAEPRPGSLRAPRGGPEAHLR
jgi:ParB/RepB/Spo0J family partition protein